MRTILFIAFVLLAATNIIHAETPAVMNYQGYLTDDAGNPITGQVDLVFAIYDDPEAAVTPVWVEAHLSIDVVNGQVAVLLGQGTPPVPLTADVFAGPDRWLGVMVGADPELTPRSYLVTVPYAFRTATVDGATGGSISGPVFVTPEGPGAQIRLAGADSALTVLNTLNEPVVVITDRTDGGGAVSVRTPAGKGSEAGGDQAHLGPDGLIVYGATEADTSLAIIDNSLLINRTLPADVAVKISNPDNSSVHLGSDGKAMTVFNELNDPIIVISERTDGGGAISVGTSTAGKESEAVGDRLELSPDGLIVLGATDTDTSLAIVDNSLLINRSLPADVALKIVNPDNSSVQVGTNEKAVAIYDDLNDSRLEIGLRSDGGGAISFRNPSSKKALGTKSAELRPEGLIIYGVTESDTSMAILESSVYFPDGSQQFTQAGASNGLPQPGGTMTGPITSMGDPYIKMGKGNFGSGNTNVGTNAFVAGENNVASGNWSTVGGGFQNYASDIYSTVGGGISDSASGAYAVVSGGHENLATNAHATVGGGAQNLASNIFSTVGGGQSDSATGAYAAIPGGFRNIAAGDYSSIGGGVQNQVDGYAASIGGGRENQAAGDYSTVAGGYADTATGLFSTVGGGTLNTASGLRSTVPGGENNTAAGDYSIAAGRRAKANHSGSIVLTDATDADFASTGVNQFLIRAAGGVGIGTDSPSEQLDVEGNIHASGTITSGNSIIVDGTANTITSTSGAIGFDNENLVTTGSMEMASFKLTATPSDGHVLTSNASGVGTWQAAAGGGNWTLGTAGNDVLISDGQWGIARNGATLYGVHDSTHVNLGVGGITGTSGQNYKYAVVSGGASNIAGGAYSTVGGGSSDTAGGTWSTVAGGRSNSAPGSWAFIGGGAFNRVDSSYAAIGGGSSNVAAGARSVIGGGFANVVEGASSTVGGGEVDSATGAWSVVSGGRFNTASNEYSSVGGGLANKASGNSATISGGVQNQASGPSSTISGGSWNNVSGDKASISGGWYNIADDTAATVGGGSLNKARGIYSVVAGGGSGVPGDSNYATGAWSVIGGGYRNSATHEAAAILSGQASAASGENSVVCGGWNNTTSGDYSIVGGGTGNVASGIHSSVFAGQDNLASDTLSVVISGYAMAASGRNTFVGCGGYDTASGWHSAVVGGQTNVAGGWASFVGGGAKNFARGDYAVILGGGSSAVPADSNSASGEHSVVVGGSSHIASGAFSTIPGGSDNSALGKYSFAAGRRAKANHHGSFVWGDTTDADIASTGLNQFIVRASGGTWIYSDGAATTGVTMAAGGGSWASVSDRNLKENIRPVDGQELLDKLAAIPINEWNYISQDDNIRHMGPMAQDFMSAFGIGEDNRHITTIDADGVALAAIKALYEKSKRVDELEQTNQKLSDRLDRLERMILALSQK